MTQKFSFFVDPRQDLTKPSIGAEVLPLSLPQQTDVAMATDTFFCRAKHGQDYPRVGKKFIAIWTKAHSFLFECEGHQAIVHLGPLRVTRMTKNRPLVLIENRPGGIWNFDLIVTMKSKMSNLQLR
jgi:hypothetical protein